MSMMLQRRMPGHVNDRLFSNPRSASHLCYVAALLVDMSVPRLHLYLGGLLRGLRKQPDASVLSAENPSADRHDDDPCRHASPFDPGLTMRGARQWAS